MKFNLKYFAILCLAASIVTPAFAQTGGADIYKTKCAMCHGADGLSNTPAGKAMKAMALNDPSLIKASDADLFGFIKDGKEKMPAYKDRLTDDQIKDVVLFIRTLQK